MNREAKKLAELMLDTYGGSALDDRPRVVEWLADHGLPHDEKEADEFERHMRWLYEE